MSPRAPILEPKALTSAALIEALCRPEAYAFSVQRIDVVQTHISMIFLAGPRVYKVKKPVHLGFVDYSTLELRRQFCEEEVRLNSRLAPGIYLGVQAITMDGKGRIRVGGDGTIIDYSVEMLRLPQEQMLNNLLDQGAIDNQFMNDLVALLVRFHRESATGAHVDEHATPGELRRQVHENFDTLAGCAESGPCALLTGGVLEQLRRRLTGFLDAHTDLLRRRGAEHRIREGHGDLHSGNICRTSSGIVIYDCIEFSRRFRCRDVACEVAFLAMDLDARGYHGFAGYLVHRYSQLTSDPELLQMMPFYKPHLAVVRAKVAALRSIDATVAPLEQTSARRECLRYVNLACRYLLGPALIVMCGLPGTGKSHIARHFARGLSAALLRSDVVRKQLAGVAAADHCTGAAKNIYSAGFTRRTYARLLSTSRETIRHRKTAVVDATMATTELRNPFRRLAALARVPFVVVYVKAPVRTVRARLAARARDPAEVSDADWIVYADARRRFEPPREMPSHCRVTVHPASEPEACLHKVVDRLMVEQADGRSKQ